MGIFDFFKGGSKDKNDNQDNIKEDGSYKFYYHLNGKLDEERTYKGEIGMGLYKFYYENGKLKETGNFEVGN